MTAAVIEFNSLPDAVRTAAQDDDFFLGRWRRFVLFFVSGVEVGRVAFEFGSAGIHSFVNGLDAELLALVANLFLSASAVETPDASEPSIGKSHPLRVAQNFGGKRFHRLLFKLQLHVVNLFELVQKPGIDRRCLAQLLDGVSLAQRVAK